MPEYTVRIESYKDVTVEADSEEEAEEKAIWDFRESDGDEELEFLNNAEPVEIWGGHTDE